MTTLAAALPQPIHTSTIVDDEEFQQPIPSQAVVTRTPIPPYGRRKGWKPTSQEDFGDGGAYPECHIAQYPLNLGKKKTQAGNTLALQVDSEGNVRYDAIAHQGQRQGKIVQSQFKDLVPLAHRKDLDEDQRELDRPSEEEVQATTEKTRQALEKLVTGKIKVAQPKNVPDGNGKTSYVRYTPGQQGGGDGLKQRIIKMTGDPLEPPRFKHKKIPRGPPSPPPPVLRSPPRKATAAEQKEWMIPPYGRGLQDFSEALYIADRHAREEVRQRALMQQKLAQKEKEAKEENLRLLAQPAPSRPTAESRAAVATALGADKRREREREMRMSNMGAEQRAKMLARQQNRDISEKVALGLAKPTISKESMLDSRLFNRESLNNSFGDDDGYGLYDRPLFHGSTAAAAIYKARGNIGPEGGTDEAFGGGTEEGIGKALDNDRFGLGRPRVGFEGANEQEVREGPVQFEKDKDSGDVFGLDKFLDEAKGGRKRGLDTDVAGSRKRLQLEKSDDT
ncbi:SKIP/SNW domain-containing protein [Pisolithus microcarpus]|nr:SKIP/SNW domain-containing protein [Pisolithus microcarpus]